MLGLSFGKILLIVIVAVIAWRGLRIYQQVQVRLAEQRRAGGAVPPGRGQAAAAATDLVACPRCGTFVPNGTVCRSVAECRFRAAS